MTQNNNSTEEYITLKDIINKIIEYIDEVKSRYKILLLAGLFVGLLSGLIAFISPYIYKEKLTFMMDEKSGEAIEGLSLITDLFGGGGGDENLGKILQLFESKKIINNTLFDTIVFNEKRDVLANHMLDQYGLDHLTSNYKRVFGLGYKVGWPKKLNSNPDFRFTSTNVEGFSDRENLYLRLLYERVAGSEAVGIDPLLSSSLDENTGIMTLFMESEYQDITLGVLRNIYKQLSEFFVEKTIEKQKKTYDIIKLKKDSVIQVLRTSEYALADFKDRNRSLVTVKGYLKQLELERNVTIMNVMYAEVVKQMEATDFALRNKTPVVQVIDLPRSPIIPEKPSWPIGLIKGFLLGIAVLIFWFVIRKFFVDIMEEE